MNKLEKLGEQARIGGRGTMRRKHKAVHKTAAADDKRLQATLQRLPGYNTISGIDEVNMFKDDGTVIHFVNPKVNASVEANTFVVSGKAETKQLTELLPGIVSQLGLDSLMQMKQMQDVIAAAQAAKKDKAAAAGEHHECHDAACACEHEHEHAAEAAAAAPAAPAAEEKKPESQ
eukprot:m51a1_g14656 putative transcription factor BTF3 homolog (175) ;mRNA; r:153652-154269